LKGAKAAEAEAAAAAAALEARDPVDKMGNGGLEATAEVSEDDSDGSIEDHPFFEGLKEDYKKEKAWDAETILSTYTTTDNHPTAVRRVRTPAKETAAIQLDRRTGLPFGIMLPAEEERRRREAAAMAAAEDAEDEYDEDGEFEVINKGEPRPKGESTQDKKQRKAEAKAAQAMRRAEKKATKTAFRTERAEVAKATHSTTNLPSQSLSRW